MSGLDLAGGLDRRRGRRTIVAVAIVLLVALAVAAWWYRSRPPEPGDAATAFAAAWDAGDPSTGPVTSPAAASESWAAIVDGMGEAALAVRLDEVEPDEEDGARASASLSLAWTLPGDRTWSYTTRAPMTRTEDGWRVRWSAAVAHPDLDDGATLQTDRTTSERADVLGEDGRPIVTERPVVEVGIQPSRVDDVATTVAAVRDVLDLDLEGLPDRIEAAEPDRFVRVVTLREADYEQVRDALHPVPGTVFQRAEQALAPTRTFARATLGQAGPVTAELVEEHPERYEPGDVAGLSGLQRTYDDQLAGRPGLEVRAVPPEGSEADPATLFSVDPEPGTPVTVTLDHDVQQAADATLADVGDHPSALVAIRVSDGHVLAVANGPAGGGLDLALTGRYAPGSTFKVVTTSALLGAELTTDEQVPCPPSTTVDGRSFSNAEDQALGEVPFHTAFANSCNTAFVALSATLPPTALRDAAAAFGLGTEPHLGVPAFGGEVPETETDTDLAASTIGQGRILVSPFAAANLAAATARGAELAPSLVLGDGNEPTTTPLPDGVADDLAELMREVVTDGSGSALADVPGAPVHAKTGTAEYGDEVPPRTHAWVIGWQDDVAFAVLVAETPDAYGGQVAAPLAADFLTRIAGG